MKKKISIILLIFFFQFLLISCARRSTTPRENPTQANTHSVNVSQDPGKTDLPHPLPGISEVESPIPLKKLKPGLDPREYPLPFPPPLKAYGKVTPNEERYFGGAVPAQLDRRRDSHIKPFEVITKMGLKPGDAIADIGCGPGYFTLRFSRTVGKEGKVFAIDIDPRALKALRVIIKREEKKTGEKFENIKFVMSEKDQVALPDKSLDYAFLCEVDMYTYTIFYTNKREKDPEKAFKIISEGSKKFTKSIYEVLKDDGKLIVINKKKESHPLGDQWDEATIRILEMNGFKPEKQYPILETHYFLVFTKTIKDN